MNCARVGVILGALLIFGMGTTAFAAKPRGKPAAQVPVVDHEEATPSSLSSHWLDDKAVNDVPSSRASGASFFAVGSFVLLLAGGAIVVLYRKHPGALVHPNSQQRIDLLAVRSLGGRQKLCLVETLGERLLIAVGENDATLISHLPGGALPTAAEADGDVGVEEAQNASMRIDAATSSAQPAAAPYQKPAPSSFAATQARWVPQASEVFRSPQPQAAQPASPSGDSRPLQNADVAGLSRWRGEAADGPGSPS